MLSAALRSSAPVLPSAAPLLSAGPLAAMSMLAATYFPSRAEILLPLRLISLERRSFSSPLLVELGHEVSSIGSRPR